MLVLSLTDAETLGLYHKVIYILYVTDVAMPVRAVCKPHSPDLKKRRSSD